MLKPFVLLYKNRVCTEIREPESPEDAMKIAADFDSGAAPGDSAMVVYAMDRKDLETDKAHTVGGRLDEEGDSLTEPEADH